MAISLGILTQHFQTNPYLLLLVKPPSFLLSMAFPWHFCLVSAGRSSLATAWWTTARCPTAPCPTALRGTGAPRVSWWIRSRSETWRDAMDALGVITGEMLGLPSGEHTKSNGKSPFLMGKATISMAIFNCYVSSPEGMTGKSWPPRTAFCHE